MSKDKHRIKKKAEALTPPASPAKRARPTIAAPPMKKAAAGAQASPKRSAGTSTSASPARKAQGAAAQTVGASFPVVGVGASAGGLEAFTQLLAHLPLDSGMAFVLVQHLAPAHESILTTLLSRATKMSVREVTDDMTVEPDHVYVIPPNTNMTIAGGVLRLRPRQEQHGQHRPIDHFLRSLAEDQSNRAIGVILSGTATDGTLGLEAIKAEGGITFAQDPQSAKYDSMPRSAIATGCVDFFLTPAEIAKELARLSRHPYVVATPAAAPLGTDQPEIKDGFKKILLLLRKATSVDFSQYKANTLHRRIMRRVVLNKLDGLDEYAQHLRENAAEVVNLYHDILINVTSFFRHPETFTVLKEKIFAQLALPRAPNEPIRVWVLGCSTGEEAYSIAMSWAEFAAEHDQHIPVQIFATDLNEKGIEHARSGLYAKNIAEDVSPERLRRFFTEADGGYRISKPLRDMCVFARQNVITDPPFSRMDLISCRNLLIYLEPVLQKQVMPLLHYALKPTGTLWLGASETTGAASDLFAPIEKKHRFYAKKPATARTHFNFASSAQMRDRTPPGPQTAEGASADDGGAQAARREADQLILAGYAPASVLINEELEVVQTRGHTMPYLEQSPGKTTRNLLKMARTGLLVALRESVRKARQGETPVRREGLRVEHDGESVLVNLEVLPLKHLAAHEHYFLVLFEPTPTPDVPEPGANGDGRRKANDGGQKLAAQQIKSLKQELAAAGARLQSVIEEHDAATEELQSASEEVQSANEELQSINEEMETAKEELESANEELTTLNDELQNRNTELGRLNDDLTNLLGSVQMPILMLDSNHRIRRFTPAAEKVLQLIQTDVGRPIGDLKLKLNCPDLAGLITEVIDTVSVKELECQDMAGRWYSLRIRPYKTLDNKIDGAVVVLVDIDALKQNEARIAEARDYAASIVATGRAPLIVLDESLRVKTANQAFYETFKVKPAETEHRIIYELGNRQWDIPELRTLLEELLPTQSQLQDFEVEHEFAGLGRKTMQLNARRLDRADGTPQLILLSIEDITHRLAAQAAVRASELRYRRLFEAAQDGILTLDPVTRRITDANPYMTKLLGYERAELLGKELWEIGLLKDEADSQAAFRELREQGFIRYEDLPLEAEKGQRREVEVVANLYVENGHAVIQCNIRDITERKRAEAEHRRLLASEQAARAEAENANRVKDEFLATVSHEIRTPLTAIQGWAEMLRRGGLDAAQSQRALETIERNARAQAEIIKDLLDVSRIISGKLLIEARPVELVAIIEAALDVVRPTADAKSITLAATLDPAAGLVFGDGNRLQQIIWNLLANAIKFTPKEGGVAVRLERAGTNIAIIVQDTGQGIGAEFLPHVFDRFRQADNKTTRAYGGLGLGLAIVRHLVEAHGGTVRAESLGAGQGATFTVALPLIPLRTTDVGLRNADGTQAEEAVAEQSADRSPQSAILTGVRVLVVDDEPDARELLNLALAQRGGEVRECASAAEALAMLDGWLPDVIVSDIGMPGEDGYMLLRKIRAREPEQGRSIPALALTGYASAEDEGRSLAAGFQTHMSKPIKLADMAAAVAKLAGRTGES